ncbi:MAG: hypothetical protein AB7H93_02765 [Vicinamibacterales bacterium]
MALAVGSRLGPYEVLATLGAGGMGEVYRATDTNLEGSRTRRVTFDDALDQLATWSADGSRMEVTAARQ